MRKNPIGILAVLAFAVLMTGCSQQADIGITTKVKSLWKAIATYPTRRRFR